MESAPGAGSRVGRYLFLRQLTSSYVGSLWETRCEAEQQLLALARVVKLPTSIDSETQQALAEAAWDSMELDDESIVRVADAVFGTGWFALVHDHYDGDSVRTVQRRIQERKSAVPVPVALRIVLDGIEAFQRVGEAIDELGVPWRSATIDPGSLLVCDDGRTRLLDGFVGNVVAGVPKMARDSETLAYAAPEQFASADDVDERTHVFRLAVIAWELLSSKRLLVGSRQVMERRLKSPIIRADRVVRVGTKASEKLAKVIEKALSLERAQRFASVAEFADALRDTQEKAASQEEVVQFMDALAGRESTLARLVMDKPPRLSDAIKSVRPTADVQKSFAEHVRGLETARVDKPRVGQAPDAMFRAFPKAAQPPRVQPRDPAPPRLTPPPPARPPAPTAQPLSPAIRAQGPHRPRFKTLVGLADELPGLHQGADLVDTPGVDATAPMAAALAIPEPQQALAPASARQLAAVPPLRLPAPPTPPDSDADAPIVPSSNFAIGSSTLPDRLNDDWDDDPTQAYASTDLARVVAEAAPPRQRMESGAQLASSPPPAPDGAVEATLDRSGALAGGLDHSVDGEVTLPAAGSDIPRSAALGSPEHAAAATNEAVPTLEARDVPTRAELRAAIAAAQGRSDRRLLTLTLLFAATTLILGVVAFGLFMRSQSAEQSAAALAAAPLVQTRPAAAGRAIQPAPAPAPKPVAALPAPEANTETQSETRRDIADATEDAGADNEESTQADTESEAAAQATAAPRPAPRRPARRAKPRKTAKAQRYVPDDI